MKRKFWLCLALGTLINAASGCSSSVRTPPLVAQPQGAFTNVPYPPPAAFVELIPAAPNANAVWLDGHWIWQNRYYVWRRGGWVIPPPRARYALWQTQYTSDGGLIFARGAWYDEKGARLRAPKPIVAAGTPPNATTPEFQSSR